MNIFTDWSLYSDRGWHPIPTQGKIPALAGCTGESGVDLTSDQLAAHARAHPDHNIALRMPMGILGIDIDAYGTKQGRHTLNALEMECGPLPPTYRSSSRHDDPVSGIRFFRVPTDRQYRSDLGTGADIEIIRREHRLAVVYPSRHPDSRAEYRWEAPGNSFAANIIPSVEDLPELPERWVARLTKPVYVRAAALPVVAITDDIRQEAAQVAQAAIERLISAPNGSRNNVMFQTAATFGNLLAQGVGTRDGAIDVVSHAAYQNYGPGHDAEIARSVQSGIDHGLRSPYPFRPAPLPRRAMDAIGNVHRFWDRHAHDLVWVNGYTWYRYDGRFWKVAEKEFVNHLVMNMFENLFDEESHYYSDTPIQVGNRTTSELEMFTNFVNSCKKSATGFAATANSAAGDPLHTVEFSVFNSDPDLLNVANGMLNTRTRELYAHSPIFKTTTGTNTAYIPDADCPKFKAVLARALLNPDIRIAIQVGIGYSVFTEGNPVNLLFFAPGTGGTGKSTILDAIRETGSSGDDKSNLVSPFEVSMLARKDASKPNPHLFDTIFKRMIYSTEAGLALSGNLIKRLTGNDSIRVMPNYAKTTLERKPSFTPWIATNQMPEIQDADKAIRRRMRVIRFDVEQDYGPVTKDVGVMLATEEGPGILNWMLDGYHLYLAGNMPELLKCLDEDTDLAYGELSDLGMFFADMAEPDPSHLEPYDHIKESMESWCTRNNLPTFGMRVLGSALEGLGWRALPKPATIDGKSIRFRRGYRLKMCLKCDEDKRNGRARVFKDGGIKGYVPDEPMTMDQINKFNEKS